MPRKSTNALLASEIALTISSKVFKNAVPIGASKVPTLSLNLPSETFSRSPADSGPDAIIFAFSP